MTTTGCLQDRCEKPAKTRGYCERHYRRRLHTGRYGYRDVCQVRDHLTALRALGWTYEQIAEAANVSAWVPHKIVGGVVRRTAKERAA
jgi:hypothetical protein